MAASIRETFEETGLTVDSCSFIFEQIELRHTPEGEDFNTHCFYAHSWSGTIVPSHEGDVRWVTVDELKRGSFPEYNLKSLEVLKTLYPNIKLK
jgi:8-oxo-dGTP pyrophosphatase MutT (NUDIX family)